MNPEDIVFEEFFAERLKQKGFSVKKLADMTGISPRHLQEFAQGNFGALPSAPYVRGYLIKLGEALDFDGETWWQRIKSERRVKNSGATDSLPENRYLKRAPTRMIIGIAIAAIVVLYFTIQFPKILGRPTLTIITPSQNPLSANINPFTIQGTVKNADTVLIDNEQVTIAPDGTWQKQILLSDGPNIITITAKKFLGTSVSMTQEVDYQAPLQTITANGTSSASSTNTSSSSR